MAEIGRGHADARRPHRLRRQRIHRKSMGRVHRLVAHREESARGQFQHVVGAVAQHDARMFDAIAPGQRILQIETVAVRIQSDGFDRLVHRGHGQRAATERVLVGGQLDDATDAQFALQLGNRFAGLVRRNGADVGRSQIRIIHLKPKISNLNM